MTRHAVLGEFEQLVLLAVLRLGPDATGSGVSGVLEDKAGRDVSRGALYSALNRLEEKGHLEWEEGTSTPERGGHPSRVFSLTPAGLDALRHQQEVLREMRHGIEHLLEPGGG